MTWCGTTLEKLCQTARVTEDKTKGIRTVKIGGIGNATGKKYLLRFVHKDTQDGNIRVTIVGNNQAGFTIAFAKDSETVIDAEFKAQPMDKEGTLKVDGGSRTGYAYINLHTIHNTTVLELPVSGSNGTLPRIDRVILRNDETERKPSIFILEGAYSSNPQPPELTNNDTIQEKCLAEIYVAAGAVAISQSDITDTRADTGLCGFIASQFEDFDFSQFTKQFNAWFALEKKSMEQDHANFIEEYAEMTQAFMTDQEAQWNKWFKEKQTELSGDIAGKLQLQIDDVKEKVYNIAFKVYIISTLEQITSPVTVKLTNKTTGTMQTVTVTKSQMGFYVTEAGEYTVEADLESVMVTPKAFKVTNDNLMTTQNITLREGSNLGYIGNYIGSFIAQ